MSVTPERPHWGRIAATSVLGVGVLVLTFRLSKPDDRGALWQAIGVDAGMVLVLLAVVFFLERSFMVRVRQSVDAAVQPLTDRVDTLEGSLQDRVAERLREQAEEHAEAIADLEVPTYESISDVLREASRLRALAGGAVTVQADRADLGPRMTFMLLQLINVGTGQPRSYLRVEVAFPDASTGSVPVRVPLGSVGVEWQPGAAFDLVARDLDNELRGEGVPDTERRRIDWDAVRENLQKTFDVALAQRPDAWRPSGRLYELVGRWAITTAGLEHEDHGVVVAADTFVPRQLRRSRPGVATQRPNPDWALWTHQRPDWADEQEWDYVLAIAKSILPPN